MKRATRVHSGRNQGTGYFNPRPHEEGDLLQMEYDTKQGKISIHALMKRATNVYAKDGRRYKDFNPRPHEEGDGKLQNATAEGGEFQSTPS